MVRYAQRVFDRRRVTLEIHAAPLNPSTLLTQHLFHPEIDEEAEDAVARTVVCTSATLATGGNFAHFKVRCGIEQTGEELVLPAVFDFPKQALLYQPPLPAYNWRNADAYYRAAADEIRRLLEVSRGRALCLFTSWSGVAAGERSSARRHRPGGRPASGRCGHRATPRATPCLPGSRRRRTACCWPRARSGRASTFRATT